MSVAVGHVGMTEDEFVQHVHLSINFLVSASETLAECTFTACEVHNGPTSEVELTCATVLLNKI